MTKNQLITLFSLIVIFALLPSPVWAVEWTKKDLGTNRLHVEGKCGGDNVNIYLFDKAKQEIYSAGAKCQSGQFVFDDDLNKWKIESDSYQVVVGEGYKDQPDFSKTDQITVTHQATALDIQNSSASAALTDPNQSFNQATGNFSTNLEGLNNSLTQMKQSLPGTNFTDPVKSVASALLATFEGAISKINQGFESLMGLFVDQVPTPLRTPFDGNFAVTSPFGEIRTDKDIEENDQKFNLKGHDGVDFAMPVDTPIFAVDDGQVVPMEGDGYGTTLVIKHSWGKSIYGHLSSSLVKVGDKVARGEKVALSGNTGLSTGSHLHFGIELNHNKKDNGFGGKTDPLPYFKVALPQASPTPVTKPETASSSATLSPKSAATPEASSSASPSIGKTVLINQNELGFLRVRKDPSVSSDEVGQVKPGQTFTILSEASGWYKIEYDTGKQGWVLSSYVTIK